MNQKAHKCRHCKKAFTPTKIDQKFCTHRCRQAAYRKRIAKGRKEKSPALPAIPATCLYCGGGFWAKTERAVFCSTSCRTLYHRALKAAVPTALHVMSGVPLETAGDLIETMPIKRLRRLLVDAGFVYQHEVRMWVRVKV